MKQFDAKLKAWGQEFILNNNSGKFDRAAHEVGDTGSPEAFLGVYDRLGGLVLDKDGNKIPNNGTYWSRYLRWKEEQPKYIRVLEERERILDEGEGKTTELMLVNINHKRAFLGTLMTISAAVIAGLFILFIGKNSDDYINILSIISGLGFSLFIVGSSIYLTSILAQESLSLDRHLRFVRDSKKDFIEQVGITITDIDSYENYRTKKKNEEKTTKTKESEPREKWFIAVSSLFILSAILISISFVCYLL